MRLKMKIGRESYELVKTATEVKRNIDIDAFPFSDHAFKRVAQA